MYTGNHSTYGDHVMHTGNHHMMQNGDHVMHTGDHSMEIM